MGYRWAVLSTAVKGNKCSVMAPRWTGVIPLILDRRPLLRWRSQWVNRPPMRLWTILGFWLDPSRIIMKRPLWVMRWLRFYPLMAQPAKVGQSQFMATKRYEYIYGICIWCLDTYWRVRNIYQRVWKNNLAQPLAYIFPPFLYTVGEKEG